jgi:hypothetical protein
MSCWDNGNRASAEWEAREICCRQALMFVQDHSRWLCSIFGSFSTTPDPSFRRRRWSCYETSGGYRRPGRHSASRRGVSTVSSTDACHFGMLRSCALFLKCGTSHLYIVLDAAMLCSRLHSRVRLQWLLVCDEHIGHCYWACHYSTRCTPRM